MEIRLTATTADGMDLQLEDWSKDYSFIKENATIGFYPMAKKSIYNQKLSGLPPYPREGKTFRASFEFPNEEIAKKAFYSIARGEKSFLSFMDFYPSGAVVSKDDFLKAVAG